MGKDKTKDAIAMFARTNVTVVDRIRKGKSLTIEETVHAIMNKKARSLIFTISTFDVNMGPYGDYEQAWFDDILLKSFKKRHLADEDIEEIIKEYKKEQYNNGFYLLFDIIQSVVINITRYDNYLTEERPGSSSNYSNDVYHYNDYDDYNDNDYGQLNDDDVDPEAEAWEHFKEYIDK